MINYTGLDYLKIDIANQMGLDSEPFEDRIDWVNTNESQLENLVSHVKDKKKVLYVAAVKAYRDTQKGIPTGHLVGLDACASGMQVMSAVTCCHVGAKNTGLIGDAREEIYNTTTEVINDLLVDADVSYPKEVIKPAVMTHFYGSKKEPKKVFGEDTPELEAFYKAMKIVAPGACMLMDQMINSWQPFAKEHSWSMADGFVVRNKVTQMVDTKIEVDELDHSTFIYRHEANIGKESGLSNAANIVHSTDGFINRELCRRCNYDEKKLVYAFDTITKHLMLLDHTHTDCGDIPSIQRSAIRHNFISLIGIEHINEASVRNFGHQYLEQLSLLIEDVLSRPSFEVISVHDEFKCHPNYMNYVRQTYIELFAELAESNTISFILSAITGKSVYIPKIDPTLGDKIRLGEYALT